MINAEQYCPHCGEHLPICRACRECGYHTGHMRNCHKGQIEATSKYGPECVLAVELHKMFCHWNHTDECGWFYEIATGPHFAIIADWSLPSHKSWLGKAKKVRQLVFNQQRDEQT